MSPGLGQTPGARGWFGAKRISVCTQQGRGHEGALVCVLWGRERQAGRAIHETPPCSMWQGPGASAAGLRGTCWAHHRGLKWLFLWKAGFGGG